MSTPIDNLLSRLHQIKTKKPNRAGCRQWQALCPSHPDKTPSLTITECADGTVLVKCWSGCTTDEIVNAISLELKDLFVQQPDKQSYSDRAPKKKICPSKEAIEHEQLIIQIAQSHLKKGDVLTPTDHQRYQQAKKRLSLLTTKVGIGL